MRSFIIYGGILIVVFGLIAAITHFASSGLLRLSHYIILGCLVSAIVATVLAERSISRQNSKWITHLFAGFAILSCYGVCVGIAASILNFLFQIRESVAIAIAVPFGILLLALACHHSID
jgi:hypothetical protein